MVLVAMLDSGVAAAHPHLSGCTIRGFSLDGGATSPDFADRTGHGTACAAALFRLVPDVEILAVRLLDDQLRTTSEALAAGMRAAARAGARVITLSLGSRAPESAARLASAVAEARDAGAVCVAAAHPRGAAMWPADLLDVLSAQAHRSCPLADLYRVAGPLPRYVASGWPRPIEGRTPTDNLFGPSFAAVHLTARVVQALAVDPGLDFEGTVAAVDAGATGVWER
jgi:subtilisin family serine protease